MKRIAFALALFLVLAATSFAAGLLLTQRRVRRAVEHLREEHLTSTEPGSYRARATTSVAEIARLGCRALPALMDELDPELSPYYLCRVADCLSDVSEGDAPRVVFTDDADQKRRSVDLLRAWWLTRGRERHRWWRFWSARCVQ